MEDNQRVRIIYIFNVRTAWLKGQAQAPPTLKGLEISRSNIFEMTQLDMIMLERAMFL